MDRIDPVGPGPLSFPDRAGSPPGPTSPAGVGEGGPPAAGASRVEEIARRVASGEYVPDPLQVAYAIVTALRRSTHEPAP